MNMFVPSDTSVVAKLVAKLVPFVMCVNTPPFVIIYIAAGSMPLKAFVA